MTDPLTFTSASPRFALPFLFAGQAQKEFFVNEALARADMLLHPAVSGQTADPPVDPQEGATWLVADSAGGEWTDHDGAIACRQQGQWLFATPVAGMRVYDIATAQHLLFADGWRAAADPAEPSGGATVDAEARTAISALIDALKFAGIFAG